jgi:hypothetical protein
MTKNLTLRPERSPTDPEGSPSRMPLARPESIAADVSDPSEGFAAPSNRVMQ